MKKIILLLITLFLFACKKHSDDGKGSSAENGVVLKENAHLVDTNKYKLNEDPLLINQGIYQFRGNPDNIHYSVNDVIVGSSSTGYIRRITGITKTDNTITYTTTQATMGDVFENGDVMFDLSTDSLQTIASTNSGNHLQALSNGNLKLKDNYNLYQNNDLTTGLTH